MLRLSPPPAGSPSAMASTLEEANAQIKALEAEVSMLRAAQQQQLVGPLLQSGHLRANDGRADALKDRSFEMTGDIRDQDSWCVVVSCVWLHAPTLVAPP